MNQKVNTQELFIALYARACVRVIALRMAQRTTLQNSVVVPTIEQQLLDGVPLKTVQARLDWGMYVDQVRRAMAKDPYFGWY